MTALCNREVRTFPNNAALGKAIRVKISAGFLAACGLTEVELGVMEELSLAGDTIAAVRLARNTERRVAASAIAQYATVYKAASGKVNDDATGEAYGIALEAASGDASIIEVLPFHTSQGGMGTLTAGLRIASGSAAALDGGNPTPIATGLTTIVAASVQLRGTAAPGDNTSILTTDYSGADGTLNVYAWKNTGGTDPTLVASTGTETFDWIAIGT
jgi:hypothetical protein